MPANTAGETPALTKCDARFAALDRNRLVFLVGALEIGDLVVALKVPDAGGHLIDQVFVVRDQQHGSLIALQARC